MTTEDFTKILKSKRIVKNYDFDKDIEPPNFITPSDIDGGREKIISSSMPEGTVFINCVFRFDMSHMLLLNNTFINCVFANKDMTYLTAVNSKFTDCSFHEIDLSWLFFSGVTFTGYVSSRLSHSVLKYSNIINTTFESVGMERNDWGNSYFVNVNFIDSRQSYSNFGICIFESVFFDENCELGDVDLKTVELKNLPLITNSVSLNKEIDIGAENFETIMKTLCYVKKDNLKPYQIKLLEQFNLTRNPVKWTPKQRFKRFLESLIDSETPENLNLLRSIEFNEGDKEVKTVLTEKSVADIIWKLEETDCLSFISDEIANNEDEAIKRLLVILVSNITRLELKK